MCCSKTEKSRIVGRLDRRQKRHVFERMLCLDLLGEPLARRGIGEQQVEDGDPRGEHPSMAADDDRRPLLAAAL